MSPESSEILILSSIFGCVSATVYLILIFIKRARDVHDAAATEVVLVDTNSGAIKVLLPISRSIGTALRGAVARGNPSSIYSRYLETVKRRLSSAGNPEGINNDEYVGFMVFWAICTAVMAAFVYTAMYPKAILSLELYAILGAVLGIILWRSWLTRKLMTRQKLIRRALPFSLDLLTISMEAGLDFTSALSRMTKKLQGTPLGKEFSLTLHEIQLGKSRSDALRDFAYRVDIAEVRTVVASLIQADELGAPIGPILRIQAAQQRERRSQLAEEMAMKAPVKLLFPLTVFIFPTTLIVIFGPMFLKYMNS